LAAISAPGRRPWGDVAGGAYATSVVNCRTRENGPRSSAEAHGHTMRRRIVLMLDSSRGTQAGLAGRRGGSARASAGQRDRSGGHTTSADGSAGTDSAPGSGSGAVATSDRGKKLTRRRPRLHRVPGDRPASCGWPAIGGGPRQDVDPQESVVRGRDAGGLDFGPGPGGLSAPGHRELRANRDAFLREKNPSFEVTGLLFPARRIIGSLTEANFNHSHFGGGGGLVNPRASVRMIAERNHFEKLLGLTGRVYGVFAGREAELVDAGSHCRGKPEPTYSICVDSIL